MLRGIKSDIRTYFRRRKLSYQMVFKRENQYTMDVLKDLAKFCRAHNSTFNKDPRIQANLDGRREVWLRIQENLNLSTDEIYALHGVKNEQQAE